MDFEEFANNLNKSDWMGSICEVGIGLPFQYLFTLIPGASKTLLFAECPYSKSFQPNDVPRSVSHEMASRYAWRNLHRCIENDGVQNENLFSIAVSAAHKFGRDSGQSHGWTSVVTRKKKKASLRLILFIGEYQKI